MNEVNEYLDVIDNKFSSVNTFFNVLKMEITFLSRANVGSLVLKG